jgi:lysozyme family protein
MTDNFDNVLALVLKEEGGFSNDPRDPGGMTNLGVTKRIWEAFVGHPVDEAAMRALTPAAVGPLYRQNYWNRVHGDELPAGVDYAVMDFAVNSGTSRAAKTLQRACGVADDGAIGNQTMQAVNSADPITLIDTVCDQRLAFLQALPTFGTFGRGWTARVQRVKAASEQMQQTPGTGAAGSQG